jgi:hypothetical protein
MSHNKASAPCCLVLAVLGFGFFSLLWDIASEAWGLGHGQTLAIFFGIALVGAMVVEWVVEEGWPEFQGWLEQKWRARRERDR